MSNQGTGFQKKDSKGDSGEISKADMDKCHYVMNQLEKILAADQRDKEAQAKKSLQEMELYKRQPKEHIQENIQKTKKMLKDLDGKEAAASSRPTLLQIPPLVSQL